jgi:hypothetical protein
MDHEDRESAQERVRWAKRIRWAALLGALSVPAVAWTEFSKPHSDFAAGAPVSSAEVNETIDDIYGGLNQLEAAIGTCPAGSSRVGSWCIDDEEGITTAYGEALQACDEAGKSLCPFDALMTCDWMQPAAGECTAATDNGAARTWTSSSAFQHGVSWFGTVVVVGGDNVVYVEGTTGPHPFYCCAPVIPLP